VTPLGGDDSSSAPIGWIMVRDRAISVDPHRVVTASGKEILADYVVLATGSSYPFPAKTVLVDSRQAQEQVRQTHRSLAQAERILLVGAGPVGIELAGEIRDVWPQKSIVLLDVADQVHRQPRTGTGHGSSFVRAYLAGWVDLDSLTDHSIA
jgi:pyruvate/2-oxoglutarate dehydrogenase complex dihydrolipoamide dehydrogenase (E3) component